MAGISQAERAERDRLYERGLKWCNTGDHAEALPLELFRPRPDGYQGLNGTCTPCENTRTSEYQKRHPEKVATRVRKWCRGNSERAHATAKRYRDSHKQPCSMVGCDVQAVSHAVGAMCSKHKQRMLKAGWIRRTA